MAKETQKVTKRAADKGDEKKKRSKKDPNAPKRGLSAYMFFSQATRQQIKDENPEASFGQIGKLLGEKWKSMSDAEKKPFNDKAEKDKQRYEDEKAERK